MTRVGITGHRDLRDLTHRLVTAALAAELTAYRPLHGISSLAEGADQIFAEQVLEARGVLTAVIPSAGYEAAFDTVVGEAMYRALRARAAEVIELPFGHPSEEAYWAAGRRVVCLCDVLLAVWDGRSSGGVGGTADVVAFAARRGVPTTVLWPPGSRRH
jgi:hypothetical protein